MEHEKTGEQVLYICDGRACEHCSRQTKDGCRHTSDVKYAANFEKVFNIYMEKDVTVAELSHKNFRKKPPRVRMARPRGAGRND